VPELSKKLQRIDSLFLKVQKEDPIPILLGWY
jgi:hypothetical protein